jgi:2-hydroxycyclohexanecarboxyl-CoA dehydrogenase
MSRVVMVTGGASGMGETVCGHLARLGHAVAIVDIDEAGAQRVAEDLRTEGARALAVTTDVADDRAVVDAFAKVRTELGAVEILVTSAGLVSVEPTNEVKPETWRRVVDVNLTGTFLCCHAALPDMVEAGWGRILTISSSSASRGSPRMAAYAAAKGGVITLTKSLAREFGRFGITVNNIQPSGIATPMLSGTQDAGKIPSNDELVRTIPVGRLGTGDDIAAAAEFLSSDAASFITGQVIAVNGGSLV